MAASPNCSVDKMNKNKLFATPLTFLNLALSNEFEDADIALFGIPYDCG